jgi:uncharacterized protein YndB with AHSA1/START domain
MTERSATHASFTIEHSYPVEPARVFAAFADGDAKGVWMDDPDFKSDGETEYELDFRVGGHERFGGVAPDGKPYSFDALFYDIVPDQRIVYSYEMYMAGMRMSVSVTTVQIEPEPGGTRLTYTEQGAFLDGIDEPDKREEGTRWLMDNLGKYLAGELASS